MIELITIENEAKHQIIKDVVLRPLKINKDETGVLVETLRTDWTDIYGPKHPFAMQYYSITQPGIARDESVWHFHPTLQDDRFLVTSGAIVVAVADSRRESFTKGLLNLFYMTADISPFELLIPRKTLHGFMVTSDSPATLLNSPTQLHDPAEEGRIPYSQAQIKTTDGKIFVWDMVRKMVNV